MKRSIRIGAAAATAALLLSACGGIMSAPLADLLDQQASTPVQAEKETARGNLKEQSPAQPRLAAPRTSAEDQTAVAALQGALVSIYEQVNPSVVNIQVVGSAMGQATPALPDNPFFGPDSENQGPQVQRGLGSGFVWDLDGHIVTNNHVVAGADKITVIFYDGEAVAATLVGRDPDADLAVIKVDVPADRLAPVTLADSTQAKVGQLAIAIGSPFGQQNSMTVGFVSALGRQLPVSENATQGPTYTIPDIIQSDVAINPGNSGGVLVDDQGHVLGVTAAIESPVRANSGVGYVIPSVIVQKIVPVLIKDGRYEHAWLGLSGASLNPDLAKAMGFEENQRGVLVAAITASSPAEGAGLRGSDRKATIDGEEVSVGGDVITAIDGEEVKDFGDLVTHLARHVEVGQTVTLTILRDGKEQAVDVTIAARPDAQPAAERDNSQDQGQGQNQSNGIKLGIAGAAMTPEIAEAMKLPPEQAGVLVLEVQTGTPADNAGLRGGDQAMELNGQNIMVGGDVITAIDGQPVSDIAAIRGFLQQAKPGQEITLDVLRDGKQQEIKVALGQPDGEVY